MLALLEQRGVLLEWLDKLVAFGAPAWKLRQVKDEIHLIEQPLGLGWIKR